MFGITRQRTATPPTTLGETFALSHVPVGHSCTIAHVAPEYVPAPTRRRLAELGLRAGMDLTVTQRTSAGGRVLKMGTTRYAVDGHTARSLLVSPA